VAEKTLGEEKQKRMKAHHFTGCIMDVKGAEIRYQVFDPGRITAKGKVKKGDVITQSICRRENTGKKNHI